MYALYDGEKLIWRSRHEDSENFDICAVSTRPTLLSSEFDDEFDNIMFVPLEIWMSDWLFQINLDTSSYVFTQFLINLHFWRFGLQHLFFRIFEK